MWAAYLFQFNSSSLLPLLWVVACLASFLPLGLLFYVAAKLRKLNAANTMKSGTEKSSTLNTGSLKILRSRQQISKIAGVLFVCCLATLLMTRLAYQQRGYCTATGDFAESDHMTVLSKQNGWFNVLGKDGRIYEFYPCPQSQMGWKEGTVIDFARYEMRDGCADFSSPLASVVAH